MSPISIKGQMLAFLLLSVLLYQVFTLITRVSQNSEIYSDSVINNTEYAFLTTTKDNPLNLATLVENPDYLTNTSFNQIPWEFSPKVYWLRVSLHNTKSQEQSLYAHFDNLMLEDLQVFQVTNNKLQQSVRLGWDNRDLTPFERSVPSFSFVIDAKSSTDIYARIDTEGIAKTGIKILTQTEYTQFVKSTHLIHGVLVGIMLVIALYNLILFFVIRDNLYLIYIGYIISILMMSGVVIGFGHHIWPDSFMRFFQSHIISINLTAMIFTLLFALYFLKYHEDRDRYFKAGVSYASIMIGFSAVALFIPEYVAAPIYFALMAGLYGLCLVLIIRKALSDFYWAKFYIISWLPLLIGAAIQPLELTGQIPSTFSTHYAFSLGVVFEITLMAMALAERMRVQRELALYNATHDLISKLPNQSLLSYCLQSQLDEQQSGYLCLLKIKKFQTLSAYISSSEGDRIASHVQQRVNDYLAASDHFLIIETRQESATKVAQLTEDTFAIIAKSEAHKDQLVSELEELMNNIYCTLNVSGFSINLTSLFGISTYNRFDNHADAVIKRAFQAVEQTDRSGKHLRFYRERDSINQSQQLSLASDLQNAIRNGELELYHQPQIDLVTRQVVGSEVLVRWTHKKLGKVLPEEFIPIAEDMGLINELTTWVLGTACQHLHYLTETKQLKNHKISVNISGKDLSSPQFLNDVSSILNKTQTPPGMLTFELTESVMVDNFQDVNHIMKTLFNLGVHFSIDDYGTGYSSLAYISQMAFTALKIDKSFIQNMDNDAKNFTIVKTTLDMARALNLKVVAEGIENPRIEQLLIDCKCGVGQGYFYSPPIPFSEYCKWISEYQSHNKSYNITAI